MASKTCQFIGISLEACRYNEEFIEIPLKQFSKKGLDVMLKKILIILGAWVLVVSLAACSNNDEYEDTGPTPEELRAKFELFFEENNEDIIKTFATEGEDVRLELRDGYEFLMTILLDDVELDDENRALYILTFDLTFSQMTDLFRGLATDIKEAAEIDQFRLSVVFVDINEEQIAQSYFDVDSSIDDDYYGLEEEFEEYDEEAD